MNNLLQNSPHESDVAIIGMACRLPDANTLDKFWQNLRHGVESISHFSSEELLAEGHNANLIKHPNYVPARAVLSDVESFDASFFGVAPREAEMLDPQHRLFLECALEALEHAGYGFDTYREKTGVYAGMSMSTYLSQNGVSEQLRNDKDYLTTNVSYKLNLRGPSVNVQSACSTSLVAVHLACQSLLEGECSMALAGGVSIRFPKNGGYLYEEGNIFSPDGHCRTFDAKAQGTVFGDGLGIIVLKRLEDALADGDTIHAVIKGSAINNDGALKVGFTAPSVEGQAEVITEAIEIAEVAPETITYIEAHGTGTGLGDPIEMTALNKVFQAHTAQKQFCAIGSLKTNVGHLNRAAGVASLIKVVLALKHGYIPPSLHFESPNPEIDFANSPFFVNTQLLPWHTNGIPRRAGVSSFGIGGTNAHVVVEEAPSPLPSGASRDYSLLLLSAKSPSALDSATLNLANHLRANPDLKLADVAYTLQVGRESFNYRRLFVCRDNQEAISLLESGIGQPLFRASSNRPVTFMFSGQGAQYVNMGRELYEEEATFREQVDHCSTILKPLLGLDLRDILYPTFDLVEEASQKLRQTIFAQPALFVIEYALAQLWMEWGVQPQAMIGHSIGEYVAATLAGVFEVSDALRLVSVRGQMMQQLPAGKMLAVSLPAHEIDSLLEPGLSLAAMNAPSLSVVSGISQAIDALQAKLSSLGIEHRLLHTSHAFHSEMMAPIMDQFIEEVRKIAKSKPEIPILSNVTGTWMTTTEATDPTYWAEHLLKPVRFSDGIGILLEEPEQVLLEVGPGNTLATLAKQHPFDSAQIILSSLHHPRKPQSDVAFLLHRLGQLWQAGGRVDWEGFYREEERHRLPLPTYPYERQLFSGTQRKESVLIPTAERKADLADWFYLPAWKQSALASNGAQRSSCYLLFMDACGVGSQLRQEVEQTAQEVIEVQIGTGFEKINESTYTLNPQHPDDYQQLLSDLSHSGRIPNTIVHLWSVTPSIQSGLEWIESHQARGFNSLLYLAQALGKQSWLAEDEFQLITISNHLQSVTGEESLCPEKATILGPIRVIPREYPNIRCRSIDMILAEVGSRQEKRVIKQLMRELTSRTSAPMVAYRGKHRWVQLFEPIRLEQSEQLTSLRRDGVYLIIGQLGRFELTLAQYLVEHAQAKLTLTTSSDFPVRSEWNMWLTTHDEEDQTSHQIRQIQELEELGATVLLMTAEVTNQAQMEEVVEQTLAKFGQLNGVIYCARILKNGLIQEKTKIDTDRVLKVKVQGTLVLDAILQKHQLDFWVLCSSITSILPTIGLVDYTAANIFLDTFAHSKSGDNYKTPVLSINWPAWRDIRAQQAVSDRERTEAFNRILRERWPQVVLSSQDLQAQIEANSLTALSSQNADEENEPTKPLYQRPVFHAYAAPRNRVEQFIADLWQEFFGLEAIGIHDDFFELGGHSLSAMRLLNRLQEEIGELVQITAIFTAPTIAKLALYLEKHYPESARRILGLSFSSNSEANPLTAGIDATKVAQARTMIPSQLDHSKRFTAKNPPAIFILAPNRSGTTLLRVMLGGHPQLFSPPSLSLLKFETLAQRKEVGRFSLEGTIRALMQINNCDSEEARRLMQGYERQDLTTQAFYNVLQQAIGEQILVEKTPSYALYPVALKRAEMYFDNPLYIHLVRHPYGMIRSFEKTRFDLLGSPFRKGELFSRREIAELTWLISHQNILKFFEHVPEHRQHRLRFEDLVREPYTTVLRICQFLGIDFHPDILEPHKDKKRLMTDGVHADSRQIGDPNFHQHQSIDPRVADKWIETYQANFLGEITWKVAESFGYQRIADIVDEEREVFEL